ncbi:MAG: hypothetical protein GF308_16880 [Candidatus Heimdallarchaeota archaeon]|nr:hypothetical protein [Candidatus Heimdallarchaeota archaeon]
MKHEKIFSKKITDFFEAKKFHFSIGEIKKGTMGKTDYWFAPVNVEE